MRALLSSQSPSQVLAPSESASIWFSAGSLSLQSVSQAAPSLSPSKMSGVPALQSLSNPSPQISERPGLISALPSSQSATGRSQVV